MHFGSGIGVLQFSEAPDRRCPTAGRFLTARRSLQPVRVATL